MSALQNMATSQAPVNDMQSMTMAGPMQMGDQGPQMMQVQGGMVMQGPGQMQPNMGMNPNQIQQRMQMTPNQQQQQRLMMQNQMQQGGGPGPQTHAGMRPQMMAQNMPMQMRIRQPGGPQNMNPNQMGPNDPSFQQQQYQMQGHGPPPQFQNQMGQPLGPGPGHQNMMTMQGQQMHHQINQMQPNMNQNLNNMVQTPSPYGPSPSAGLMPSPMSADAIRHRAPMSMQQPSPVSLNTPQMMAASPSQQRQQYDDHQYHEKLKQLSKYIDPLRKMIARMDRDDPGVIPDKKKDGMNKVKNLLDIVMDTSGRGRVNMETLLKCEQVLEKMDFGRTKADGQPPSVPQILTATTNIPKPLEHNICQPLLDAVMANIKKPYFNHTLHRTFGPAVAALTNSTYPCPSPPAKRQKLEEITPEPIPELLQGEIARLDTKFKVQLDPLQHEGSSTVHIICRLDGRDLPSVPPICVRIPNGYPQRPPQVFADEQEYDASPFLKEIDKILDENIRKLPRLYSLTSLLHTWVSYILVILIVIMIANHSL